eukprot:573250_1
MDTTKLDEGITKKGYLQKKSLYLSALRRRWMVLKGDKLYSYKTMQMHQTPTEIIDLNHFDGVSITTNGTFKLLSSSKQTRVFVSSSINELDDWCIQIIKTILNHKKLRAMQTCIGSSSHTRAKNTYSTTCTELKKMGLMIELIR